MSETTETLEKRAELVVSALERTPIREHVSLNKRGDLVRDLADELSYLPDQGARLESASAAALESLVLDGFLADHHELRPEGEDLRQSCGGVHELLCDAWEGLYDGPWCCDRGLERLSTASVGMSGCEHEDVLERASLTREFDCDRHGESCSGCESRRPPTDGPWCCGEARDRVLAEIRSAPDSWREIVARLWRTRDHDCATRGETCARS
jgi:hypothetical protein